MKHLKRISLHNLSQAELAKRETNLIRGGKVQCACVGNAPCGCQYEGAKENENDPYYGGASTEDNSNANFDLLVTADTSNSNNAQ